MWLSCLPSERIGLCHQLLDRAGKLRVALELSDAEVDVITAMHRGIALFEYFFESRPDRGNLHNA